MSYIQIIDGKVPEDLQMAILTMFENEGNFSPNQKSFLEDGWNHMVMHMDLDHPAMKELTQIVRCNIYDPGQYFIDRCYTNCHTSSSSPKLHQDSYSSKDLTVIYYPHLRWHCDWAGETVFYQEDPILNEYKIMQSILPRPGRLVVFDASIPHSARTQSRQGPMFRYTLAYKLMHNDNCNAERFYTTKD